MLPMIATQIFVGKIMAAHCHLDLCSRALVVVATGHVSDLFCFVSLPSLCRGSSGETAQISALGTEEWAYALCRGVLAHKGGDIGTVN